MINRVVLVGRLTRDIELRKTTSNLSTCRFTLACDRRFSSNQNGPTADFISCVAWRQNADFLARYAKKGDVVALDGSIQTGSYTDRNGNKVYTTDVVADTVRLPMGNRSNNNVSDSPRTYETHETFTPSNEAGYSKDESFDDDFANTPSLDISSDDLPFY